VNIFTFFTFFYLKGVFMKKYAVLAFGILLPACCMFSISAEENPIVISENPIRIPDTALTPVRDNAYNGIAEGPVLGLSGRTAIGSLSAFQSRWGAAVSYVQPTGPGSQLKCKAALPLSGSQDATQNMVNLFPDIYSSVEYEWGMKYLGVGCGLALMYMQPFAKYFPDPTAPMPVHFDQAWATNWVVTLRAGKPNTGFRGKLSWPIPIFSNGRMPGNYLWEYSALGVLGNDFMKGGIGIQGMIKGRESREVVYNGYTSSTTNHYTTQDMYFMAPCGKMAVRIGKQSVICLSTDVGALLFPRPQGLENMGAPYVQLDYTFSFKPLKGAEVFDGTF
jgi:hypothetical protein